MQKTIIEFFSGSKTVSNFFVLQGWRSITVDFNPKFHPSICCDIRKVNAGMLPKNAHFIWASPDCSRFSRASASRHWKKETFKYRQYNYFPLTDASRSALEIVNSTVDLILLYPDIPFIIENPIGRIHHTAPLKKLGHYRYAVNYADFGFPYSKETYLFSNMWLPFSTKKVSSSAPGLRSISGSYQRSIVPGLLVKEIFEYLNL